MVLNLSSAGGRTADTSAEGVMGKGNSLKKQPLSTFINIKLEGKSRENK